LLVLHYVFGMHHVLEMHHVLAAALIVAYCFDF
jgi:hypothetical protein